jgi:hypothetical protein
MEFVKKLFKIILQFSFIFIYVKLTINLYDIPSESYLHIVYSPISGSKAKLWSSGTHACIRN